LSNSTVDYSVRDKYAAEFNASKNLDEKLRLLELMQPYDKKLKDWMEEGRKLDIEREAIDTLYEEYQKCS
jgi:hypothetical protein